MPHLKILFYNWTDLDDREKRGGGVSVYQKNLIEAATQRGDEAWFLSSGTSHSPFSRRPFIRELRGTGPARQFQFVNSAILSPGQAAFGQPVATAPAMEVAFSEFLKRFGPFDVVHFNNLEGIPVSFLGQARAHAVATKLVFSVHNYFPFCPQVNLWFQEKAVCRDFCGGKRCVNCLAVPSEPVGVMWRYRVEYCLRWLGIRPLSAPGRLARWLCFVPLRLCYRAIKHILRATVCKTLGPLAAGKAKTGKPLVLQDATTAARFAARRRLFAETLNTHVDHILAVSRRVAELVVEHGINPDKVRTLYIGTKFARKMPHAARRSPGVAADPNRIHQGVLRLLYLGYMRRDKGFYFFLEALAKLPAHLASRLRLVFATKISDRRAYERLRKMAHRFDAVTFYDGYTHAQLPDILSGVDLGVVPVLWEDNLPQVAMECVASGVPVLTSDRGGAQELLDCPELVFKAGSIRDFGDRIKAILDDPDLLRAALASRRPLFTPEEHYECLRAQVYQSKDSTPATENARTSTAQRARLTLTGP